MTFKNIFKPMLLTLFSTAVLVGCEGGSTSATSNETEDVTLDYIWEHQTYFKAANSGAEDLFGRSIAADGDTLVVGAPGEDSDVPGIANSGSTSSDDLAEDSGAVYIYKKTTDSWAIEAVIKSPGGEKGFGWRVAIDGDRLAVATDNDVQGGQVFLYQRFGGTWSADGVVNQRSAGSDEGFGFNIDLNGTTLVVGSPRDQSNSKGVLNESESSLPVDVGGYSGAAYVYERGASGWVQQAYIKAPFSTGIDEFGNSVAVDGDRLLVGSPGANIVQRGVFADRADWSDIAVSTFDIPNLTGAVFSYTRTNGEWTFESVIANGDDSSGTLSGIAGFGARLVMDGDTAAVFAVKDTFSSNTVTSADDFADLTTDGIDGGSVSIYRLIDSQWQFEAHLKASNITSSDAFGIGLNLRGNQLFVGSYYEDSAFRGVINGDGSASNDNSSSNSGAGYIFTYNGTDWSQLAYLKGPTIGANSWFGMRGVFLNDDTLLVSAPYESRSGNTVRSGLTFDNTSTLTESGAVFLFNRVLNPDKDRYPPMTFPAERSGSYNESNSPSSTLLTCIDYGKNSQGCANTYYTLDGSDPSEDNDATQIYNGTAINLNQNGNTTLKTFSVDGDGNAEPIREYSYTIDATAPTSSADVLTGEYAERLEVTLSCEDANACDVYYTLDNSEPTSSSQLYEDKSILIQESTTLKFLAVDEAGNNETTVNTETYVIDVTAPTTSLDTNAGTYPGAVSVALACSDSGTGCDGTYYTTDGSEPTSSSTLYTSAIVINATTTLRYYSVDSLGNEETAKTAEYVIDTSTPVTSISPAAGTYGQSVDVTLSCTDADSDCSVYYTLDDSTPTTSSTEFSSDITISSDTTVRYLAVDEAGNESFVFQAVFEIDNTAPTSSASVAAGLYNSDQSVTLSCTDDIGSCSVYYTTDGSTPTSASTEYSSAIAISASTTLRFLAIDEYGNEESVNSVSYVIDKTDPTASTTTVSDTYTEAQNVMLTCSDNLGSCTIYYTTDGGDPTTSSSVYSSAIAVTETTTIKFIAVDSAGNESSIESVTLTFVGQIGDIFDIESNGNTTIVLKSDGTVALWGDNLTGVLGHAPNSNGDTASVTGSTIYSSYNPAAFTIAGLTNVVQVALGDTFALALKDDGTVWAWGQNEYNELGHEPGTNGDVTIETEFSSFFDYDFDGLYWINPTPVQVSGLTNIVDIDAGSQHSLAVDSSGNVFAWGSNTNGQLGDNSTTDSFSPVQVADTAGTGTFAGAVAVNAGGNSSFAINDSSTLYGFGNNSAEQLGLASAEYDTPQQILTNVSDADISGFSSVVLRTDGTVYHMGDVFSGIVGGDGNPMPGISTPSQVAGLSNMVEVRTNGVTTFATDVDGFTYAWGQNSYAQAGTNSTTDVTTPTLTSVGNQTFVDIAKGYQHTAVLMADGTVFLFGLNDFGQMGHAPNTNGDTSSGSAFFNQAGVTLNVVPSRTLDAPESVTAADATGGELSVSWTAVTGATAYDVYYSTTPGVTSANGTLAANVTSGSSFAVPTTDLRFFVTVVAKDGSGNESVGSLEAQAYVAAP